MDAAVDSKPPFQGLPRRQYICRIPADASHYREEIELRTLAFDENDLRHLVWLAFGRLAAEGAIVEEVRP